MSTIYTSNILNSWAKCDCSEAMLVKAMPLAEGPTSGGSVCRRDLQEEIIGGYTQMPSGQGKKGIFFAWLS